MPHAQVSDRNYTNRMADLPQVGSVLGGPSHPVYGEFLIHAAIGVCMANY